MQVPQPGTSALDSEVSKKKNKLLPWSFIYLWFDS